MIWFSPAFAFPFASLRLSAFALNLLTSQFSL